MILTIPYNPDHPGGYEKLTDSIRRYGRHPNHTLFVASMVADEDKAFDLAMQLKDHFGRYFAISVMNQPDNPIQAANRLFVASMKALQGYEPASTDRLEPVMLYFDPSWRPVKLRWLDEFQSDYILAGAPVTFGDFRVSGDKGQVCGPVAISSRFPKITKLMGFLPGNISWRDYLAWEIINNGVRAEALGRVLPAYIRPFDP